MELPFSSIILRKLQLISVEFGIEILLVALQVDIYIGYHLLWVRDSALNLWVLSAPQNSYAVSRFSCRDRFSGGIQLAALSWRRNLYSGPNRRLLSFWCWRVGLHLSSYISGDCWSCGSYWLHLLMTFIMHSLNAVFLLGDTTLNCLRFPWFRIAYFVVWTGIFVISQWIIHACTSIWWPYPFLDLSLSRAPLWYALVGLLHIPCYSIFGLIVEMKVYLLSKWLPESCQCFRWRCLVHSLAKLQCGLASTYERDFFVTKNWS